MKTVTTLYFIFSLFITNVLYAQVTIGSDLKPNEGALLDIKEYEPDAQNATAIRGLGLPRINLTTLSALADINFGNTSETEDELKKSHVGLTVYNINREICLYPIIYPGIYTWGGNQWEALSIESSLKEAITSVERYTDHEGNAFRARKFGDAGTWMLDNMYVTSYADGTPANFQIVTAYLSTTNPVMAYPGGDIANFNAEKGLGYLYNWYAAGRNGTLNSKGLVQGICPNEWHIPSDDEWSELEAELIRNPSKYSFMESCDNINPASTTGYRGNHGLAMVSCYTSKNVAPGFPVSGYEIKKGYVADMGGFSAHFPGIAASNATNLATYFHIAAHFWTSTPLTPTSSRLYRRGLTLYTTTSEANNKGVYRASDADKTNLYSVRCKKDD